MQHLFQAYAAIALTGHEKFVLSGTRIVLEHQNNKALVFVNGQPPLAEFKNWDVMLSEINELDPTPQTAQQLGNALQTVWKNIPQQIRNQW